MTKRVPEKIESMKLFNNNTIKIVGIVAIINSLEFFFVGCEIISNTSFLYIINTAINVPKCATIDSSRLSASIFKSFDKITMCPLDDTGKNSVNPCIIPIREYFIIILNS